MKDECDLVAFFGDINPIAREWPANTTSIVLSL
jgi:hypothetical protein